MKQMNQIILEGNVIRDPVSKITPNGTPFCEWTIASDRYYKDKDGNFVQEAGFYQIEAWGERFTSMIIENALKGRGVRIVGRLKQDRWKTEDGQNRSRISIVAEHIDFKPFFSKDNPKDNNLKDMEQAASAVKDEISSSVEAADVVF